MDRGLTASDRQRAHWSYSPTFWVALLAAAVGLNLFGFVLILQFLPQVKAPEPSPVPIKLIELAPAPPSRPTPRQSRPVATPRPSSATAPVPEAKPQPEVSSPVSVKASPQRGERRSPQPPTPPGSPNTPTPPSPTPPSGSNSEREDSELPGVDVTSDAAPAQFQVRVAIAPSDQDVASRPAQPRVLTQTFEVSTTDCDLTPESIRFLGATVELLVEVGPEGQVVAERTRVQTPVDRGAYDALALCLANQWSFIPAADQQGETFIPRVDLLRLQVTITRLNSENN